MGLADGCPESHQNALDPKPEVTYADLGIVRCCSKNGDSCISPEGDGTPGKCSNLIYKEAVNMCANMDKRLCTAVELAIGICCDASCQSVEDIEHTWHSGEVKGE